MNLKFVLVFFTGINWQKAACKMFIKMTTGQHRMAKG